MAKPKKGLITIIIIIAVIFLINYNGGGQTVYTTSALDFIKDKCVSNPTAQVYKNTNNVYCILTGGEPVSRCLTSYPWSFYNTCSNLNGQAPLCSNTCSSEGSFQCNGNYRDICALDTDNCLKWMHATYCNNGCSGGTCQSSGGTCNPSCSMNGQLQCDGNFLNKCTPDNNNCLNWAPQDYCTNGCSNAQCKSAPASLSIVLDAKPSVDSLKVNVNSCFTVTQGFTSSSGGSFLLEAGLLTLDGKAVDKNGNALLAISPITVNSCEAGNPNYKNNIAVFTAGQDRQFSFQICPSKIGTYDVIVQAANGCYATMGSSWKMYDQDFAHAGWVPRVEVVSTGGTEQPINTSINDNGGTTPSDGKVCTTDAGDNILDTCLICSTTTLSKCSLPVSTIAWIIGGIIALLILMSIITKIGQK